jgi:uncharacterized membrane protein HdeD (DUF308 family)
MSTDSIHNPFKQFAGFLKGSSILMIVLGLLAITLPFATGIAISVLLGILVTFCGAAYLAYAFAARGAGSFLWRVLVGVLYILGGIYLAIHPGLSLVSLTLLLAVIFFLEGISEIAAFFSVRPLPGSSWILFNGIVTLILSFLIWREWPSSSIWAVGTLVGINLIMSGFSGLFVATAAHKVADAI